MKLLMNLCTTRCHELLTKVINLNHLYLSHGTDSGGGGLAARVRIKTHYVAPIRHFVIARQAYQITRKDENKTKELI